MHMVRNSVDHGIETPAERASCGKPARGTITLSVCEERDSVVLQLHDDGKGLQRERIVEKAIERRLIANGQGMSDADVFALIFVPGFSTAERVTNVSGRGVGMDVVRRNLDALRGEIDISSEPGQGATFTMRVPLTIASNGATPAHAGDEPLAVSRSQPQSQSLSQSHRVRNATDAALKAS
jgi:two-component system, chemotaxis family, sensor kinase CheA